MINTNKNKILFTVFLLFISSIALGQESYKYIIAKEGDGIIKILKRNHLDPNKYKSQFIALNEKKIGKDHHIYAGLKYKIPIVSKSSTTKAKASKSHTVRRFSIFGSEYDTVSIMNQHLKGCAFYLVSGHGGPDPGAIEMIDKKMITEDEYAYDVTLRLGRELIKEGATVYIITRDPKDGIRDDKFLINNTKEVCYPNKKIPRSQKQRLRQRTKAVNNLYKKNKKKFQYQRLLVMHVDAHLVSSEIDLFFYYFKNSSKGKKTAFNMREIIRRKYEYYQPHRGYKGKVVPRDLHMLSMTDPPSVFIELGNIKNSRDQKRLLQPRNRQLIAEWMVEGIKYDYKKQKR